MKKLLLLLSITACALTSNLQASADLGELTEPLGSKEDCGSLQTDIKSLEKKPKKTKDDIVKLNTQKFYSNKYKCK